MSDYLPRMAAWHPLPHGAVQSRYGTWFSQTAEALGLAVDLFDTEDEAKARDERLYRFAELYYLREDGTLKDGRGPCRPWIARRRG